MGEPPVSPDDVRAAIERVSGRVEDTWYLHDKLNRISKLVGIPELLSAASVHRDPVDRAALLFQLGVHDTSVDPPYRPPGWFSDAVRVACDHGLLTVGPDGAVTPCRGIEGGVENPWSLRDRTQPHRQAAAYWEWRAVVRTCQFA
ncbi:hypothetical protein AB0M54_47780 [Actinoplanes sp. NPDC051470]|uniref:hypothetical protein n=1 Tax=Actinoplanes sp. NPDC051470 TaxID=3157224 RepID=UPI0034379D2C